MTKHTLSSAATTFIRSWGFRVLLIRALPLRAVEGEEAALSRQVRLNMHSGEGLQTRFRICGICGNSIEAALWTRRNMELSRAYGNYVFGVYMAAHGYTLPETLDYAQQYAFNFSRYCPGEPKARCIHRCQLQMSRISQRVSTTRGTVLLVCHNGGPGNDWFQGFLP